MAFDVTGRRLASVAALLLVAGGLSACTTTEGTNAFTDFATFEREVMTSTAQGVGLVPKAEKPDPTNPRGPLVLPKKGTALPAPTEPYESLPGLRRTCARNSLKLPRPSEGLTTSICGAVASSETGARSLSGSNGMLL